MRVTRSRSLLAAGLLASTALVLTGCSAGSTDSASNAASDLTIGSVDLKAAGCPATVTIQTDWNPEAEHGHLYSMFGKDAVVDASNKSVSGPLYSKGEYTGVNLEVRAGGPAIGFQTVSSQMYTDSDITLGYANTDESLRLSNDMPTTAVFAPLEINPQMIMWDPATYPDVKTIADLTKAGAIIKYFGGAAYMDYLIGAGIVPEAQADGGYDGTPANFVSQGGKDAQQGFASAEPYVYENEVESWDKPVKFQLIHDAGYQIYASAVSVRTSQLKELTPCLTALVPVLQQAEVDYFADPAPTNAMILDLVTQYDTGWVYSQGVADYSVKTMRDLGLASNGDNDYIGDFDEARVQKIIDTDTPIFTKLGTPPKDGITASDLFTNEFLDKTIGLK
ncbi:ABC transporter substrate-binding protein [Agreia sp. COWG]|uniref:ABC transporter substrate-binding protein n=1 Tax=Agreia sp. COWG TaxID=2773266 RepID=UPI001925DAE1|nr:ABC transporter substrate-binding protein [Agreia sp. COWG]CAD5995060.1 Nitrate ABC transporter substrate-binding protein [Agreia sp. COWG]